MELNPIFKKICVRNSTELKRLREKESRPLDVLDIYLFVVSVVLQLEVKIKTRIRSEYMFIVI